jgi:hypothetical protein
MGYGLDDRGSIPGGCKRFSLLHNDQTVSEAHPASDIMGTAGQFPLKKSGRGVNLTTPIQSRRQEWWTYASTSPYSFIAQCLIKQRDR